jgi:hypothetical protein
MHLRSSANHPRRTLRNAQLVSAFQSDGRTAQVSDADNSRFSPNQDSRLEYCQHTTVGTIKGQLMKVFILGQFRIFFLEVG